MGVAGCGKSSVGAEMAERLSARYFDGDDLHPPENIEKMSAGHPLDDADRAPWLSLVGAALSAAESPILVGCSALKRKYRDIIRDAAGGPVVFVHLAGAREVIEARMSQREGHFMPVSLLDSQFAALEDLQPDETGVVIDIDQPFDAVVEEATEKVKNT